MALTPAPSGPRIRIMVVDDSAVMRSLLRAVIATDPGLEVAGTAADGASALSNLEVIRPDLVLLDVEMPIMDGLVTLKQLRARGHRMPVIMCSSLTQRGGKVTIEALAGGASDYVAKPAGQSGRDEAVRALAQELIPKIRALTTPNRSEPQPVFRAGRSPLILGRPVNASIGPQAMPSDPKVLAIGVSTGGPAALDVVLPALPASFPLPILIVQHMPELFTSLLAERLSGRCSLRVREAAEGDIAAPGTVFIARGNWHLEVKLAARSGASPMLHLTQGPLENHCRPAADVLFRSVAAVYGANALALVLTGMGSDGLAGCRTIRERGGGVLVQDQASSTVWGMPGAVANAGLAHKVLPLKAMASEILRIANCTNNEARQQVTAACRSVV